MNLLNAEDGGHRRCICVTNNEVPADRNAGEHNAKDMTSEAFVQVIQNGKSMVLRITLLGHVQNAALKV